MSFSVSRPERWDGEWMKGFGRRLPWPNSGTHSICMGLEKTKNMFGQDNRRLGRDSKREPRRVTTTTVCSVFYIRCRYKIMVKCAAFVMQPRITSRVTLGSFRMWFFLTIMLISVKFALTWRSRCQWLQHNLHFTPKVPFSYAYKINYGQTKNSVPKPEKTSSLQNLLGDQGIRSCQLNSL